MNQVTIGRHEVELSRLEGELLRDGKARAGIDAGDVAATVKGPFDGKINSIYTFTYGNNKTIMFRARISQAFRYEDIVKEKILFPLLDGTINVDDPGLGNKISKLAAQKVGHHVFSDEQPPIVPVQDLLAYDETRKKIPYMYSILEYVPGISLYDFIEKHGLKGKPAGEIGSRVKGKVMRAFEQAGEFLGRFHEIRFPGFTRSIVDIGNPGKHVDWRELFIEKTNLLLKEASTHEAARELVPKLRRYFDERTGLIPRDETAVMFHNDFQPQNFIIDESDGHVNAIIDFDNWQVGTREQDFVKMQYWGLNGLDPCFERAFMEGYSRVQALGPDFQQKVDLYKMQWFVLVFNFEMDKLKKQEQNTTVDRRFPSAEKYLDEMARILDETR